VFDWNQPWKPQIILPKISRWLMAGERNNTHITWSNWSLVLKTDARIHSAVVRAGLMHAGICTHTQKGSAASEYLTNHDSPNPQIYTPPPNTKPTHHPMTITARITGQSNRRDPIGEWMPYRLRSGGRGGGGGRASWLAGGGGFGSVMPSPPRRKAEP